MKSLMGFICMFVGWTTLAAKAIGHPVNKIEERTFSLIQAETCAIIGGIFDDCGTTSVGNLGYGGMVGCYDVDFGTGANDIIINYSNNATGSQFIVQAKLDNKDDPENFLTFSLSNNGSWCNYFEAIADSPSPEPTTGVHHVYFIFYMDLISSEGPHFDAFALANV
ncbi:hypothetical protein CHUAL_008828 [Chamberlinius hualienensis]